MYLLYQFWLLYYNVFDLFILNYVLGWKKQVQAVDVSSVRYSSSGIDHAHLYDKL